MIEIKKEAEKIQRSIDLQTGPLVKLGLFKGLGGDYLLIVIHHLVTDGVSWRILLEDFDTGYLQAEKDETIKFQDKTDSFQYWTQKLTDYAGSKTLLKELPYWQAAAGIELEPLPVDHEIQAGERTYAGNDIVPIILPEEKTQQLLTGTNWAYNTEINDILLTALGLALKQWANVDKIAINMEGHGRETIDSDIDISRTVGWFATQYPVLLDMTGTDDISFAVKHVKETLRRVPKKGIGYGLLQYFPPGGKKESPRFMHTPEIVFNYLGRFGETKYNIIDRVSEISDPCTGENVDPGYKVSHKLDIEGVTMEGRLNLYIFYNRREYEKKTIEKLSRLLQTNLEKVIEHCLARQTGQQREATPSDLGCNKISIADLERITHYIKSNISQNTEIQSIYPLSPMQSGMLFHWLKDKKSPAYFEQTEIYFRGEIQPSLFEDALNIIVARYDILRTIFTHEGLAEPLQIVLKQRKTPLRFQDISHLNEADQEKFLAENRTKDREQGFDLTRDMLTRFSLFKTGDRTHIFMWTFHHTLLDGWCLGILRQELTHIYHLLEKGEPIALEPSSPTPYVEYIRWLEKQDKEEALHFWEKYLEGYEEPAGLPRMGKVVKGDGYRKAEYHYIISEELMDGMNRLAGLHRVTINTFFQTLWGVLLQRYTNRDDVVFGSIVSGRPTEINEIERMIGLFINMVPVRIKSVENQGFAQLLERVQAESLGAKKYEYLPVADVQSCSELKGDLIDHIFVFENYLRETGVEEGLVVVDIKAFEQTNYDFNIIILPEVQLHLVLNYNTLIYERNLIENTVRHFEKVLKQVLENPGLDTGKIEILTDEEKNQVLHRFNDTKADYPHQKTIHRLFEEQSAKMPGNLAVVGNAYDGRAMNLTYMKLNENANRLAKVLRDKGVDSNFPAAIMLKPSQEIIIGLLGILKAGGTFLPIDHNLPLDRITYILKESGTRLLITSEELSQKIRYEGEIIIIENVDSNNGEIANPRPVNKSGDAAYIIYTSGSTGKPKGVVIEHGSLVNLCYWHNNYYEVTADDRATKFASFGFDASVWEIFPYLIKGAAIYIVPEEIKLDVRVLNRFYEDNGITISFLPTQVCEQFMKIENKTLRVLLTGGDKLKSLVKKSYRLYNNYGPTENTVVTTSFPVTEFSPNIPIGKPIANNQVYILDRDNNLQPVGIPGELCIGGDGVARGYLNRPELTAEKFIDFPDSSYILEGSKLYRTGDLARWLPDGNIEFLGRIDFQIKVRGFRIELGEIENQLLNIENINEAVVLAKEDKNGEKYLCAYFTANKTIDGASIKDNLSKNMPSYMVPSYFIPIAGFPLTPNGKLDRKALPDPETSTHRDYTPPANEMEKILSEVWEDVLNKKVGIHDNFFEIGGDSIKTILISSKLFKWGLTLNVNDFFLYPTIHKLAKQVKKIERTSDQVMVTGKVRLTPIQCWFFENHPPYGNHFNQSILLSREKGFDEDYITKIFAKIVRHHDALRMVYQLENGVIVQENRGNDGILFDLVSIPLKSTEKEAALAEIKKEAERIQRSIDLQTGPLVKLGLFKGPGGDYLLIVIHHLVVDGVSWRILLEDFDVGYLQAEKGETIKFQDKTDSFQYWAQKLTDYAGSKTLLNEWPYWQAIEKTGVKPLPVDHEIRAGERTYAGNDFVPLILSEEKTRQLLTGVNWAYNTEINDILLTALGLAVKQWAGIDKIPVHLEGHGRETIVSDTDISRTVGWFTTQYPVLLDMAGDDISFAIKNVKETLRQVPKKGIGYGLLQYITPPEKKKSPNLGPTPEILFNYLGQFGENKYNSVDWVSEISAPCTGESVDRAYKMNHKIDIGGGTRDGRLTLYVFYHRGEYEKETVEKFTRLVLANLEKVIDHCLARQAAHQKEVTPSDLGCNKISIADLEQITHYIKSNIGESTEIQSIYPLSPMQSGMLFHWLKDKKSPAYFEQMEIYFRGEIQPSLFEEALNIIVARHDILRTIFTYEGLEEPLQIVLKQRKTPLRFQDISHLNEADQEKFLAETRTKDREQGFDLSKDHLTRFFLFKTDRLGHIFMWAFHHALMDGWSLGIIRQELTNIYRLLQKGESVILESPPPPYVEYIRWLEKQDKEEGLLYWERYLEGYEEPARLPRGGNMVKGDGYLKAEYHFTIPENVSTEMNRLAGEYQATINILFQALWGILLQKYNNRNDVAFGAIVSGRPVEITGIERMVGLFINMTPIRVKNLENQGFALLLEKLQVESLALKKYEYLPVTEVQSRSELKGDLIDHILVFENYPLETEVEEGLAVVDIKAFEQTNYDFNIIIIPWDRLHVHFSYNALVYDRGIIEIIARHFEEIIRQIVANPNIDLSDIEIMTTDERERILYEFNNTGSEYPGDKIISQLYEEQVEKTPDRIALIFQDARLTYRELNKRSNRLAGELRRKGIEPDTVIAVMAERSLEIMIGIFAIQKSGGVYLPLEPGYPQKRIIYILKDSEARLLLVYGKYNKIPELSHYPGELINLENTSLYKGDGGNPSRVNKPGDSAYIIYTSGSTGNPKGVIVEHRSLVNRINWMQKCYPIDSHDVILQKTTLVFDVSIWELFWWSWYGATQCLLIPGGEKDPAVILKTIDRDKVTTLHFVPSMLNAFLGYLEGYDGCYKIKSVKQVFASGEALTPQQVENFYNLVSKRTDNTQLVNLYGPTEATVDVSYFNCPSHSQPNQIPIGKPIDNTNLFIINDRFGLQAIGVPGELYISGVQLARGYLNRPELTCEKFGPQIKLTTEINQVKNKKINKSFAGVKGELFQKPPLVVYKTGDLARWLPDGNIEFLGRMDYQVKVRGFRIELGEIESQLLDLEKIKEAVVLAKEDKSGEKYLCAYFTANESIEISSIRDNLSKTIPSYMIPSYFMQIDRLPLTANGKLDRKALPEPETIAYREYTPPGNETEKILAEVWEDVLSKKVGIHDNFFEIGGDSIKIILIVGRLQKRQLKININDFFAHPTIQKLANYIDINKDAETVASKAITRDESLIAIDIQRDYDHYLERVKQEKWPTFTGKNDYKHILITGAAGYLGVYITHELLKLTDATLYLPIRGKSQAEAEEKIKKKMDFYFGPDLYNTQKHRLVILKSDLAEKQLGLSGPYYEKLSQIVDAVVHSA
ncbi:MAG TPA: amino acid adenylation domain-containing protein, partial [Candidatus Deferrimicrobium sp.]|nr:amino acid adenylation domain-containing protein [Candidatus Deferrimicrobium sp.]